MKPVFVSSILLNILLSLSGNPSAQKNSFNQEGNSKKETNMSVSQNLAKNRETVRRLYEDILNTGKLELMKQIIAEDYVGSDGQNGPHGFAEPVKKLLQGFPDIQFTVEDLFAESDRVVVRWTWQGTHTGTFANLKASQKKVNGEWIAAAPMGKVKIRFANRNTFGILDHDVILESEAKIHNSMRVVPNGSGSEVVFTLFRPPDMSDEKFLEDAKWVEKDLRILRECTLIVVP